LYFPVFSSFSDISLIFLSLSFAISTPFTDSLYPSYISEAGKTSNSPFLIVTSFIIFDGNLTGSASPSATIFSTFNLSNS